MPLKRKQRSESNSAGGKAGEKNELFLQIEEALREEEHLFLIKDKYLDPMTAECFRKKWRSTYDRTKKKTGGLLFGFGLSGREIRQSAPVFMRAYERLSDKIQAHNNRLASQKEEEAAALILPVEGKSLDSQQLRCITKEARNHLVLAGAGTGKTTTIVGYVKYLLKKEICKPEDILVLSFYQCFRIRDERAAEEGNRPTDRRADLS